MKVSKHAAERAQQRGISMDQILLISIFGEAIHTDQGGIKIMIKDRTLTYLRKLLDKCKDSVIISDPLYDTILTTYHLYH